MRLGEEAGGAGRGRQPGAGGVRPAAGRALPPLRYVAVTVRRRGAPEQSFVTAAAAAACSPEGHGAAGGRGGARGGTARRRQIVTEVWYHNQVLARRVLVDTARVHGPGWAVLKLIYAGLAGSRTADRQAISHCGKGGGGGCGGRRSCRGSGS